MKKGVFPIALLSLATGATEYLLLSFWEVSSVTEGLFRISLAVFIGWYGITLLLIFFANLYRQWEAENAEKQQGNEAPLLSS